MGMKPILVVLLLSSALAGDNLEKTQRKDWKLRSRG